MYELPMIIRFVMAEYLIIDVYILCFVINLWKIRSLGHDFDKGNLVWNKIAWVYKELLQKLKTGFHHLNIKHVQKVLKYM